MARRPLAGRMRAGWRFACSKTPARSIATAKTSSHLSARGARGACGASACASAAHSVFMPALISPRAAQTLAMLRTPRSPHRACAVPAAAGRAVGAARAAARSWRELRRRRLSRLRTRCGAVRPGGALGRGAAPQPRKPPMTPALARLIGRPVRDLRGVLHALGYQARSARERGRARALAPARAEAPDRTRRASRQCRSRRWPSCCRERATPRRRRDARERAPARRCLAVAGAVGQDRAPRRPADRRGRRAARSQRAARRLEKPSAELAARRCAWCSRNGGACVSLQRAGAWPTRRGPPAEARALL